jgi:F-type H+-transporting ATPase subunit delta
MSAPPGNAPAGIGPGAPDVTGTVFEDDQPEVTRSYATALLAAAEEAGRAEPVLDELDALVADVLVPHPRFAAILAEPSVPASEKDKILTRTFENRADPLLVRFLRVLNRRGRLGLIAPVARAARALWDRKQNRRPVLVRSAVPLEASEQAALGDRLARMLAATPILSYQTDPALIGGLIVQVGDDVYDASVRHRLEQLRRRLIEGKNYEIQSRRDQFSHS